MEANLPTTPGPYWWRANDECDWDPVYIREDSTVPGYEFTVIFPETGTEIDLPDLQGQWAKAHNPDEGVEAWATLSPDGSWITIGESRTEALREFCCRGNRNFSENDVERMWEKYAADGYTCEPVTIYRKGKG